MNDLLRYFRLFLVVLVIGAAFHSTAALAQAAPPPTTPTAPVDPTANPQAKANFDDVLTEFHAAAVGWQDSLGNFAKQLFWLLAFIELVWTSIRLVMRGADLQEWSTEVVKYVFFVGFFAALLFNAGVWANDIIESFQQASVVASAAGGHASASVSPSDIFASGLNITAQIDQQASSWHPVKALGIFIAALIIMILFAAIATMIVLAWIETYFVIYAAIFFTGFGGSRFTSDYAKRVLMLAITAGAKLFVLLLIAGLLQTLAQKWVAAAQSGTDPAVMGLVGLSILGAFLCVRIPSLISSITSGQVASSSGLVAAAASMATAAAGLGVAVKGLQAAGTGLAKGAQAVHGGSMAMRAASSLASAQAGGSPNGFGGHMAHMGRTAGNLVSSGASDVARNLGGPLSARSANHGTGNMGSRMADSMTAKQTELRKPKAPGGATNADGAPKASTSSAGSGASHGPPRASEGKPGEGAIGGSGKSPAANPTEASAQSATGGGGGNGNGSGAAPDNESAYSQEKRSEFLDALRHFGNRVKSHNSGE